MSFRFLHIVTVTIWQRTHNKLQYKADWSSLSNKPFQCWINLLFTQPRLHSVTFSSFQKNRKLSNLCFFVCLELQKFIGALFFAWDLKMYMEVRTVLCKRKENRKNIFLKAVKHWGKEKIDSLWTPVFVIQYKDFFCGTLM